MLKLITDYTLYKHRYMIAYTLVGLLVGILLVAAALYVPGGLNEAEMMSTVTSSRLPENFLDPNAVIDLPFSLLQSISFSLFGVTTLSIKLPSLLLGLLSLIGIILLLRDWFRENVAVIAALIVITASQFIFTSQAGTPTIMYIFMSTWLLFLALKLSRQTSGRSLWEFLFVAVLAISLYTPLSVYIIAALLSATLLHPHLRFIVGRLPRKKLIAAGVLGLVLLAPLIMALINKPEVGLTLLGIPTEHIDLKKNFIELTNTYLGFSLPGSSDQTHTLYTLPSLLLMLLGVRRFFQTRHTARSYIITSWLVLLTPIILINPSKTAVTFVPIMLLIAAGIDVLLHNWYSLFPRNPYARIAGLLPITVLIAGMALVGIERYFYSYRYSPPIAITFSNDLQLLRKELASQDDSSKLLYVTAKELPFYEAVAKYDSTVDIIAPEQVLPQDRTVIVTRNAFYAQDRDPKAVQKVITNDKRERSDRLYLYKSAE